MYTLSNKYTTKQTLLNDTNPLPTLSACFSFYLIDKIDCSEKIFTRLRQDAPCGSTGRIGLRQRLRPDRDGDR